VCLCRLPQVVLAVKLTPPHSANLGPAENDEVVSVHAVPAAPILTDPLLEITSEPAVPPRRPRRPAAGLFCVGLVAASCFAALLSRPPFHSIAPPVAAVASAVSRRRPVVDWQVGDLLSLRTSFAVPLADAVLLHKYGKSDRDAKQSTRRLFMRLYRVEGSEKYVVTSGSIVPFLLGCSRRNGRVACCLPSSGTPHAHSQHCGHL